MKRLGYLVLGAFAVGHAIADDFAVSGKLGTLGMGVEVTKSFSESITGRIGLNGYSYNKTGTQSNVDYDFKLKLQTVSALADWYPWQGAFRGTLGLVYNNNKLDFNAKPTGNTYTINDKPYTADQIGSLSGSIKFDNASPYIGIGWGNPVAKEKDWGFVADIGVLYQGSPKANMSVTCGAAILGSQTCLDLTDDVNAERQQLESAIDGFKWYPVVSIGISKKF